MAPKICLIAPSSNTDNVLCGLSLMKISNNQTKQKKMQNYVIFVFFRKKIISKDMKAINYKMKSWIVSSILPKEVFEKLSRICLTSTKRTSNMKKKTKTHLLFLWKNRVEASKVITNSHKTLDFVTSIPVHPFPWNLLCDLSLKKLGNN